VQKGTGRDLLFLAPLVIVCSSFSFIFPAKVAEMTYRTFDSAFGWHSNYLYFARFRPKKTTKNYFLSLSPNVFACYYIVHYAFSVYNCGANCLNVL